MKNKIDIIALFFLWFMIAFQGFAKEPTTEPILRPNTEMHSAMLYRIDTNGKYIITCSIDKTAKLWNASTGEYIRTFRIPIDEGDEGKIYSCAISPDGKTIALGGWTGYDWYGKQSIYIFNTDTGLMKNKIGGLEKVISDLEFSKDGRYLVAGLGGSAGVKVISTDSFEVYKSLEGYKYSVDNVAFDSNGRLATVCDDGYIRLYDNKFNLEKIVKATGGEDMYSIAFSPDDTKIAVGYNNINDLQVLDSKNLNLLYSPDMTGANKNSFPIVYWSEDGYLFAGGAYQKYIDGQWWSVIRKYENGGKGTYTDYKACGNTILDIKGIDNNIVFGGANPDFGRMDYYGNISYYKKGKILRFNTGDRYQYFKIADNSISFKPNGKDSYVFDFKNFELLKGEGKGNIFSDKANDIDITEWEYSYTPKINGINTNFLEKYESNSSVAISANSNIIWGTNWFLSCTDKNGKIIWKKLAPGAVLAVNTIGDIVTAAYGDGTIRWHRLSDGQELMALMVNDDMKRWVLWTPSGYYTCSPGGQDMVGWHINNGANKEASFYPISKFASKYYRPDIIANILKYGDESTAIVESDKLRNIKTVQKSITEMLPPLVTIISPSNSTTESGTITLKAKIKATTEDLVTETKILINGRPYGSDRGLKLNSTSGEEKEYKVTLEEGENIISVLAKNNNGWSEPATVKVTYNKGTSEEFVIQPKLYILAIGVSDYLNKDYTLKYAAKDAKDFSNAFLKQKGKLYRDVEVKLLSNELATKDEILDGLDWLQKQTTSKDMAIIYIAGHGVNDNNGTLYYMPYEGDLDKLKRTGLLFEEITKTGSQIAGKVICFLDTCHSGNIKVEGKRALDEGITGIINELTSAENGIIVFSSSSAKQYSLEKEEWGNGAFTKAVVEGLSGKADMLGKGKISINMLDLYISERVKELTGGKQTPVTSKPDAVRDFPIAVK